MSFIQDKIIYLDNNIFFLDSDIAKYLGMKKKDFYFRLSIFENSIPKRYIMECDKKIYSEILIQRKRLELSTILEKQIERLKDSEIPPIPGQIDGLQIQLQKEIDLSIEAISKSIKRKKKLPNLISVSGLKIIFLILKDKKVRKKLDKLNLELDQIEATYINKLRTELDYAKDFIEINKKLEILGINQDRNTKLLNNLIKNKPNKNKNPIKLI